MRRRIFKSGNSFVVSLPADALTALGLREGAEVSVDVDRERGGILIMPASPEVPGIDPDFARLVSGFVERYRPALEALARNETELPER